MRLFARLLSLFFHHLYHSFAFAYDAVAAVVSFGHWIEWTKMTIPFIEGIRILELGHGPGHLHRALLDLGLFTVGLDESSQMGRFARQRLLLAGYPNPNLTRGIGQSLPFPSETFDSIVATFPAPYIVEPQTLSEVRRVLRNGGRLIVLPAAWPKNGLLHWLYQVTGESPVGSADTVKEKWSQPFVRAGFEARVEIAELESSELMIIIAGKPLESL
jgi:ubiquinone/menaquinone biosynthesis C-methylase UbiE